ncbi:MAG: MBOAT family protein [Lachnospiraceae bacterium]|nr:MBOAT family protein [Lachnospiraceae bacterium]
MLFSSMIFLWVFLPAVILIYSLINLLPIKEQEIKIRVKNIFLLVASLFFYAWGGIYYLAIMIFTIIADYTGALLMDKASEDKKRRLIMAGTLAINIAILFFFKYFNMVIAVIESIMAPGDAGLLASVFTLEGTGALGFPEIVLPIGISFFTFQAMSYVVDVYRRKCDVQKDVLDFALYISLFPQLIAGPIVQYSDIEKQLRGRQEGFEKFSAGVKRFCYGLGKKVIIANSLAECADSIWASDIGSLGTATAFLGAVCYTLQIYYDFSGYSDMAIGLGKMLGFEFRENFNYPYTSLSVREFWRRWHISLSSWFRDYVYIPLGGSRRGLNRTCINLVIVFLLTGIWHGANFTFIFWGLYYAVFLLIERLFLGKYLDKNPVKVLNVVYTFLVVMVGWIFFRSDNIIQGFEFTGQLFAGAGSVDNSILNFISMRLLLVLPPALLLSGPVQRLLEKVYKKYSDNIAVKIVDLCIQMSLLLVSIVLIVSGTYNPFIYFQF